LVLCRFSFAARLQSKVLASSFLLVLRLIPFSCLRFCRFLFLFRLRVCHQLSHLGSFISLLPEAVLVFLCTDSHHRRSDLSFPPFQFLLCGFFFTAVFISSRTSFLHGYLHLPEPFSPAGPISFSRSKSWFLRSCRLRVSRFLLLPSLVFGVSAPMLALFSPALAASGSMLYSSLVFCCHR
jgi:hypothetical protein